jgi:hypothetical protein
MRPGDDAVDGDQVALGDLALDRDLEIRKTPARNMATASRRP